MAGERPRRRQLQYFDVRDAVGAQVEPGDDRAGALTPSRQIVALRTAAGYVARTDALVEPAPMPRMVGSPVEVVVSRSVVILAAAVGHREVPVGAPNRRSPLWVSNARKLELCSLNTDRLPPTRLRASSTNASQRLPDLRPS